MIMNKCVYIVILARQASSGRRIEKIRSFQIATKHSLLLLKVGLIWPTILQSDEPLAEKICLGFSLREQNQNKFTFKRQGIYLNANLLSRSSKCYYTAFRYSWVILLRLSLPRPFLIRYTLYIFIVVSSHPISIYNPLSFDIPREIGLSHSRILEIHLNLRFKDTIYRLER